MVTSVALWCSAQPPQNYSYKYSATPKTGLDSISTGAQTDCIYTDFTVAFQSVSHSLLHKLRHSYGISDAAFQWFSSYLRDRQQCVIVNEKSAEWTHVTSGTPGGGLLSPLLFAMYINDLPGQIEPSCLMFAEDVKIYRKITFADDAELLSLGTYSKRN